MDQEISIKNTIVFQEIVNPELKNFVLYAWNDCESFMDEEEYTQKRDECVRICDVLEQLLKKKKIWMADARPGFVDIMMAAVLLHNLKTEQNNWTTIFAPRLCWEKTAQDMGVPKTYTDALFQTIEAQLGEDTPVPNVKPVANTPTDFFALAIWIVKEMDKRGDILWN